ncbi:hypothetical protein CONLIGDRAFT_719523 [Coniochaeta ligniaria NRRL 30616]|uniref:Uncharacterized protein n=1 Tax=Coniochaeta ligniaria NRRL 30616 TaxID=1408157 RepID=A0A1J7I6A3_9PEZI|nr:hypothetical protein CONLIGDRAFT_719523 [Coniochaeta ligniaria NRRL 30616]
MSLAIQPLTKEEEYFKDAKNGSIVVGSGQTIYWKQCTIKVYKSGEEGTVIEEYAKCDGQALVRKGTSLLLEDGPVIEEE